MKFTRLSEKFQHLLIKSKRGKRIKAEKVEKLLSSLNEKKVRYEHKLKTNLTEHKRKKFNSRLKVVKAQIEKTKKLKTD